MASGGRRRRWRSEAADGRHSAPTLRAELWKSCSGDAKKPALGVAKHRTAATVRDRGRRSKQVVARVRG